MISLTCTNCRAVLEIDDGFAGGVCRCQHCGTIQTVPSGLKDRKLATAGASSSSKKSSKTLYSKTTKGEPLAVPSSGLDELAQVVVSSGLTSSRLRNLPQTSGKMSTQRLVLLMAAGGAIALTVATVVFIAVGGSGSKPAPSGAAAPVTAASPAAGVENPSPAAATVNPHFCDVPLPERVVIYVIDRGSGTTDLFSYLKELTFKSAGSLGSDRKFQIIFWNNGADDAYPSSSPTYATPQSIEAARRALDGVHAHGQTDVGSALTQAVASSPEAIVLATGKGWQLDDAFVTQVLTIRRDKPIKVHTFTLGGTEPGPALATIAQRTGGVSRLVTEADLKRFARAQ